MKGFPFLRLLIFSFLFIGFLPSYSFPILLDTAQAKSKDLRIKSGELTPVTGIRYWSNPDYTRVVIDLGGEVSYSPHLLREDPSIHQPPRLYLDLLKTKLDPKLKEPILIHDALLKRVRTGQYTLSTVRVVLDMESIRNYKIFPLENPYRIVIDVLGKEKEVAVKEERPLSLPQQLGLKVGKIVIDPGHGGKDPGAIAPGGLEEKKMVLEIAKKVEREIKEKLGYEVTLTRREDVFIPLEERTAIANTQKADLFISIHANASYNRETYGIETYYLNFASDEEAAKVAARENATSLKKISDLQVILYDLMLNAKVNESSRLAGTIQNALVTTLSRDYSEVKDLGVKQAPFYVLIGAEMPSVLVETSFISNPREGKRLSEEKYQNQLALAIVEGIKEYVEKMGIKKASTFLPTPF